MKEKIKKFSKKYLIGFILSGLICGTLSAYAVAYFPSINTIYDNSDSGIKATNVQSAIDELYKKCSTPSEILIGGKKIPVVKKGDGLYKDEYEEGKYTYKGTKPNNYITFNNERWQIISINSDGTIKIMNNSAFKGDEVWDSTGSNDWNRPATLNQALNGEYYNSLSNKAQSQIVESTYYAGAVTNRNNDLASQINDEKQVVSNIKVALPTLSEYIRANSYKSKCGTFLLHYSNYQICDYTNWMRNWFSTMTPDASNNSSIYKKDQSIGTLGADSDFNTNIYPVVTLSSEVQIVSGNGSLSDPYIIE